MTLPSVLFGLLISGLYGALFHLWRGGGLGRLLLYLVLGVVGFWTGQVLAMALGWDFASLGPLHLGPATAASLLFLLVGYWLSLIDINKS